MTVLNPNLAHSRSPVLDAVFIRPHKIGLEASLVLIRYGCFSIHQNHAVVRTMAFRGDLKALNASVISSKHSTRFDREVNIGDSGCVIGQIRYKVLAGRGRLVGHKMAEVQSLRGSSATC